MSDCTTVAQDIILNAAAPKIGAPPRAIIVDCRCAWAWQVCSDDRCLKVLRSGVTGIDSSSALVLITLQEDLTKRVAQVRRACACDCERAASRVLRPRVRAGPSTPLSGPPKGAPGVCERTALALVLGSTLE